MKFSYPAQRSIMSTVGLRSLLNPKVFFPMMMLLWLFFIAFGNSEPKSLRGPNNKDYAEKVVEDPPENLIIVVGHAVMRLNKLTVADRSDSSWYLLPYQRNVGFPGIISSHVKKGTDLAYKDKKSVLIFSGGQTRKDVGPISEAASYYFLADEKKWISNIRNRVYLEEFARDSLENLLFSICRFKEVTGRYPLKVTVVGFDFKGKRFTELHRKAIGFPPENFNYIGLQSKNANFDQKAAEKGELAAIESFDKDLYGCNNPALFSKRMIRNPFRRTIPYHLAAPELKGLLDWCGPGIFQDVAVLPWNGGTLVNS